MPTESTLTKLIADAGLTPLVCARLLGVDNSQFREWLQGNRPIPSYVLPELSAVLGVSEESFLSGKESSASAVWFKFKESTRLIEADRETVFLIRRLGYFMSELEEATSTKSTAWKVLFAQINEARQKQAAPNDQGRTAAEVLRSVYKPGYSVTTRSGEIKGVGDWIRGQLRSLGILIIESPIPDSQIEGCSFYIGAPGQERPCLFVNTYKVAWFRRNMVLAHELAHALFDIESDAASLDYLDEYDNKDLREIRAEAFARNYLIPPQVLRHVAATKSINWANLSDEGLATLVAHCQVEKKTVLEAAREYQVITDEQFQRYVALEIGPHVKALTERALDMVEYAGAHPEKELQFWQERRTTTIPSRSLLLPVAYVKWVIDSVLAEQISEGKAAECLMIDEEDFERRFGALLEKAVA